MRSTRNQPFCWQEKKVNRMIRRKTTNNSEKIKLLLLYATITEMDSDFNGKDIKYYTKTISTYSGLSKDFIPKGLKILEKLKVLVVKEEREKGKYKGKKLAFTPQKVIEIPREPVTGETFIGETFIGEPDTSEDSILKEDSSKKENSTYSSSASRTPKKKEVVKEANQEYQHKDKCELINVFKASGKLGLTFKSKAIFNQIGQLFELYGVKHTFELAKFAVVAQKLPYAPTITSPTQLFHKSADLIAFYEKQKGIEKQKKTFVSDSDLDAYKKMINKS